MYLRAYENGRIVLGSVNNHTGTVKYNEELPEDFLSTFSTGKYLFLAGEIVANAEWEEPTQEEESHSLPNEFPHRKILIENGVTSIEELPEDLTSINGIGASKAEDITEFLLTLNNED